MSMIKGTIGSNGRAAPFPDRLSVGRHDSGGVAVGLGGTVTVISPLDAVRFAQAVLTAAGVTVEFSQEGGPGVIRPPGRLLS